ncbi:unnamed protein product, partial [Porites evermanni]
EYKSLSLGQLKYILSQKKKDLSSSYKKQLSEKEKIIRDIRRVDKLNKKVQKGIDIKKEFREKRKKKENKKIKSFEEYFEECIKNRQIPADTPTYMRKALERAMIEYDQGLIREKSALEYFANKYVIKGEPGFTVDEFFRDKMETLKNFLKYHQNIKFKMILVCLMEKQIIEQGKGVVALEESKAYYPSATFNNIKSTDIDKILDLCIDTINGLIEAYQQKGSAWYLKEVVQLEIHTVEFNPAKGSSYIKLPQWISNKKAIVNIQNKDEKCFLWCVLRYLHPKEDHEEKLKDLEKYENELITKGITFPMKLKDISKFEKLNPKLPGINSQKTKITYTKNKDSDDLALIFVNKIAEVTQSIYDKYYHRPKTLSLSRDEQKSFNKASTCHICSGLLNGDKVRDHCHFTGQYRGAAHNECNLRCRKPRVLPVILHNLQGYDAHLFIKQLATIPGILNCIPSTEEKYISFSKYIEVASYKSVTGKIKPILFEIRFIDSFKFLQTSLANLVSNLRPDDFHNTKKIFKKNVDLLTRKGVYPYDYVSSLEKLTETHLPQKEEFYSKLNDEDIADDDYQHAISVWNTFKCKSIRDYHDLYLKSDVLLLADVFENFRKTCLKHYNLDPAHYYTSPGLAWDACLKETGQHLQLLNDYDMLMMIERGIRGGITHISKRYAEANNKYMKNYNPDKSSSYIQYLDANNLYGWAMSQRLPTHGFRWISNITKQEVIDIVDGANHSMSNHGKKGYIFEVDLEYPSKIWESHNDYPLAPENIKVNGVEKLICHFKSRKNYVVHYRNLRQYLEMGMKITAVHRGISFYQSSWMEPYIRKNTELRKCAKNSFEKDFFKLMNNSVFGKTIENIRKRQNIILVDNRVKAAKLTSKPNFERATIFDRNLIAVHMKNTEVYFNKPVYVGQAILDLSKTLMFNFHYNYIKKKYRDKAELLFTDTDSLMYQIQTDDFYKDIYNDVYYRFDTSDYPSNHPSGIPTGLNKKVIGMFKDEVAGKQITHFIGLRPKLYTFKIEDGYTTKKCKGVKKNVVKKGIDFEHYFECLFTGEKQMRTMKIIRSENHDIYSKEVNKIALSSEDDKRKVLEDRVKTKALR